METDNFALKFAPECLMPIFEIIFDGYHGALVLFHWRVISCDWKTIIDDFLQVRVFAYIEQRIEEYCEEKDKVREKICEIEKMQPLSQAVANSLIHLLEHINPS
ncbi:MAG: hypothetical protein M0R33_13830 [Methylomonas sp.]|jgi:hypothetical protein|uniref:hypothetical protein n=1 Tax=Methylomonas sp. TaxID=418 RepID=UPI0025FC8865|nr:hypothetical protein [Methylomonas sp.]MCK9607515.1 hypothetical protein [Methylomonas sp.]